MLRIYRFLKSRSIYVKSVTMNYAPLLTVT